MMPTEATVVPLVVIAPQGVTEHCAASMADTQMGAAFRREMVGRQYGLEAWMNAWAWFKTGWEAKR